MTLWLARRVEAGVVDETTTTYLGTCDHAGCRHMVDHRDEQVVTDALDGHRRRVHPGIVSNSPGWLTFTGSVTPAPGPVHVTPPPSAPAAEPPAAEPPAAGNPASDPYLPSPTPRDGR